MTREALSAEEIAGLLELLLKMSEGPWDWHWRKDDKDAPGTVCSGGRYMGMGAAVAMCPRYGAKQFERDAPAICALRNAAPRLLATLAQRDAELAKVREALGRYGSHTRFCARMEYKHEAAVPCTCGLSAALAPRAEEK